MIEHITGNMPVSPPTSVALETLLDKQTNTHRQYDLLAVNLMTIARNLLSSIKYDELVYDELYKLYDNELLILRNIVADQTRNKLKLVYYSGFYNEPHVCFPLMSRVKDLTAKQREAKQTLIGFAQYVYKNYGDKIHGVRAQVDDNSPTPISNNPFAKVLVLTHLPTDLLFLGNSSMSLLESHTGVIKSMSQLNTKLKGKPDKVPFNKITVQIMGDTGGVSMPAHINDRKELILLADECGWSITTSINQVSLDINNSNYPKLKKYIITK